MGDLLKKLNNDFSSNNSEIIDSINMFSKKCYEFSKMSTDLIYKFGGVTIYAGGDDLLFLSPLENSQNHKTVFQLCDEINKIFVDIFEKDLGKASVSFGITINYYKFPLYEALKESAELLFENAKNHKDKNTKAILLKKSSGLNLSFISNNDSETFKIFYSILYKCSTLKETNEIIINSLIYNIKRFRGIFISALNNQTKIDNFFENIFDQKIHDEGEEFIKLTIKLFETIKKEIDFLDSSILKFKNNEEKIIYTFENLLRLCKFFSEKEGDKN